MHCYIFSSFCLRFKTRIFTENLFGQFLLHFVIYLPFSYLTAYDYKYNSNTLYQLFQLQKDIVAGRYVFVGLTFAACLILLSAAKIVVLAINGQELNIMNGIDYGQTVILISIFSLYFGIVLPLYYKFGYQKVRWLMMVATIISGAASSALSEIGPDLNKPLFIFSQQSSASDILFFIYHISQYF